MAITRNMRVSKHKKITLPFFNNKRDIETVITLEPREEQTKYSINMRSTTFEFSMDGKLSRICIVTQNTDTQTVSHAIVDALQQLTDYKGKNIFAKEEIKGFFSKDGIIPYHNRYIFNAGSYDLTQGEINTFLSTLLELLKEKANLGEITRNKMEQHFKHQGYLINETTSIALTPG